MNNWIEKLHSSKIFHKLSIISWSGAVLVSLYYLASNIPEGFPLPYLPTHYYHLMVVPLMEIGLISILAGWYITSRSQSRGYGSILILVVLNAGIYLSLYPIYTHPDILDKFGIQHLEGLLVWIRLAAIVAPFLILIIFEVIHFNFLRPLYALFSGFTGGEKQAELREENARRENFSERFPAISKIPILGWIAKKVYAEGVWYGLGFSVFVMLGYYLRVVNLVGLSPQIDEFAHMFAAKALLEGASIGSIYSRSLIVVTLPVLLSYKLFGVSILAAKYAAILGNSLAMFPLYGLMRRVNKKVAILAVALYATSPWMILVGRIVREYSFHPLIALLLTISFLKLYERLPDDLSFSSGWLKTYLRKTYLHLIFITAFLGYVLFIDPKASIKYLLGIYAAFLVSLVFYKGNLKINWRYQLVGVVAGMAGLFLAITRSPAFISEQPKVVWYYFGLLINNPIQQWYYGRVPYLELAVIVISFVTLLASLAQKKNFAITFSWANLAVLLSFYTLLFNRYDRPRYIFIMEIWFIVVAALGSFAVYRLLTYRLKRKSLKWLAGLTMAVVFVNPGHIWEVVNDSEPRINPVSGEIHYDVQIAHDYFMENHHPDDILIGSYYLRYLTMMEGEAVIQEFVYFNPGSQEITVIEETIKENPGGWVIFDKDRGEKWYQPLPYEDFSVEGVEVNYLGRIGDFFLYRWGEN